MLVKSLLRKLLTGPAGCTLMETAVAIAIISTGVGLVGTGVFQVLAVHRFWQDDSIATKETRHAASWVAGDALKATTTDLTPGGSAASQVTLTTSSSSITYSQSGDSLLRQEGSSQNVIASEVVSAGFALSSDSKVLTFTIEVNSAKGGTETLTLQNYLRLAD